MKIKNAQNIVIHTLTQFLNQNIIVITEGNKSTFYHSGNQFPLDIINTGVPGVEDWEGYPQVLATFKTIEAQGFKFEMYVREVGDETGFSADMQQDYKLVLTLKNKTFKA